MSEAQKILDEVSVDPKKAFRISWKKISIVLGIILVISIAMNVIGTGSITGFASSGNSVSRNVETFIEENSDYDVEVVNVDTEHGLYKIEMILSNTFGSQPYISYATKDGELLLQATPLKAETKQTEDVQEEYTSEDITEIEDFVGCLAEKNVKIYGANWCGWTKRLAVDTFGGFDIAEPIYVECTENEDLCDEEEIAGFPTIKIDGELYTGSRTFEGLAQATSCAAPVVGEIQASSNDDGSC